jgi:hypothetical protein
MKRTFEPGAIRASRIAAKVDATTKAVREIARDEADARAEKTKRLRAARLARDAEIAKG